MKAHPPCHPRAVRVSERLVAWTDRAHFGRDSVLFKVMLPASPSMPNGADTPPRDCLQKNHYKEEKCQSVIDALYECCYAYYKGKGDDATTTSCPKPQLLRLKMEQRGLKYD